MDIIKNIQNRLSERQQQLRNRPIPNEYQLRTNTKQKSEIWY